MKNIIILLSLLFLASSASAANNKALVKNYFKLIKKENLKFNSMAQPKHRQGWHYGNSNTSQIEANEIAIENCEKSYRVKCFISFENYNDVWENSLLVSQKKDEDTRKINEQKKLEKEFNRYIQQCEYIGFKKNTDKMGECVLKIYDTEIKLAQLNAQQRTADSSDVLTNMFLLNESLKLLNPPQPRTTTCQARPFGVYMNIYCN